MHFYDTALLVAEGWPAGSNSSARWGLSVLSRVNAHRATWFPLLQSAVKRGLTKGRVT
jgi:hypothetical protein